MGEVQKTVRFATTAVTLTYPRCLDIWFDGSVVSSEKSIADHKWVQISANEEPDRFDLLASAGSPLIRLKLGDAVAAAWERVSFLAIADLRDALALHAAALYDEHGFVLLPGVTGVGKTTLSLWYRAQGFALATDEVVSISATGNELVWHALDRPVRLKSSLDGGARLREEVLACEQDSSHALILRLADGGACAKNTIVRGVIVFPHFTAGASLEVSALTPGQACFHLIENCLNARNLPRGGLGIATVLARRIPAVALSYGNTAQLEGVLDVLTRQVLGTSHSADLNALCLAFTAKARSAIISSPAAASETPKRSTPPATAARFPRRLTIGMATYDDYDGAYFTIQSIRMSNPELKDAIEFVLIDNNPGGPCSDALSQFGGWIDGYRYIPRGEWSGTAIRDVIFEEASSRFVLCIDSHVLIVPGALRKLISYFEANPDSRDLVQGPMLYDDLRQAATHMDPCWRAGMYGTWASDPRGTDPFAPGFEIPLHGLGLFACRRTAWAGFNPKFRGFGGEEGYIHEKIRQRGGRTLCLPFLRWMHRFTRPHGTPYVNRWEDRMRNYMIGFTELGLDTTKMESHFAELLGAGTAARIFADIKQELVR